MTVEWVEVKGPSVEVAVEAALAELGIESRDDVDIEVLQEPEKGFLGIGRTDAVVRVKPLPKKRRRARSGKGEGGRQRRDQAGGSGDQRNQRASTSRSGAASPAQTEQKRDQRKKTDQGQQAESFRRANGPEKKRTEEPSPKAGNEQKSETQARETTVSREEQASVVGEFLEGLLNAFGLEGSVQTRVDDDIIYADVVGNETEALVGSRGVILQSIHELAKTVVQRKTQESARIRLDIAGYAERRREALKIYAQRLAQQVLDEGGEVMVEPMNAAERKVIHDTLSEIEGVRTYSEGEEPRRSVVIAAEE
ncbi:MAG: RNA-binding cell elongation regulator Jag/EloR [Acidimicrobiia bacterium]